MSDRGNGNGSVKIIFDGDMAKWVLLFMLGGIGGLVYRDGSLLTESYDERLKYEALNERLEEIGQRLDDLSREVRECPHRSPQAGEEG